MPQLTDEQIRNKMMAFKIKITSYLKGSLKNRFMLDCLKRNTYEGDIIRNIIELHYVVMDSTPELKGKTFYEAKEYFKTRANDRKQGL